MFNLEVQQHPGSALSIELHCLERSTKSFSQLNKGMEPINSLTSSNEKQALA